MVSHLYRTNPHPMKYTATLGISLFALCASAQPVLEYANVDLIGKTFPLHLVTDAGTADPTVTGANVAWDFSSITLQMNAGSTSFVDPATTPYASSYPTANLAQVMTTSMGTSYNYFVLTSAGLDMLAEDVGGTNPDVYTDPKTPLQFPLAYQNSFVDNYTANGTPASTTRTYSGHGTVVLPTGTYTNVVQVSSSSGTIDFYRSNPVEPLGHIEDDGTAIVFGDAVIGMDEHPSTPVLLVMPNPTTGLVQVNGLARNAAWQLMDMQGRVLRQGSTNVAALQLDLDALAAGPYALVVLDGAGRRSVQVVKE